MPSFSLEWPRRRIRRLADQLSRLLADGDLAGLRAALTRIVSADGLDRHMRTALLMCLSGTVAARVSDRTAAAPT
ncbi:hypothetical protein [Rhodococcus koreensis]|nr:hypothetical protein [Rhodococcus koreensis]